MRRGVGQLYNASTGSQPEPRRPPPPHLSPASERVVRRVNSLVEARRAPCDDRRRIIVHDQPEEDDEE